MYDVTVTDPDQVLRRIVWRVRPPTIQTSSAAYKGFLCFQHCFTRYLRGAGHPDHPMFATTEPGDRPDNPVLRAVLFLKALTECSTIPTMAEGQFQVSTPRHIPTRMLTAVRSSSWSRALSLSLLHRRSVTSSTCVDLTHAYPIAQPSAQEVSSAVPPFKFATCAREVTVEWTVAFENLMFLDVKDRGEAQSATAASQSSMDRAIQRYLPPLGETTSFDVLVHAQLSGAAGFYNTA